MYSTRLQFKLGLGKYYLVDLILLYSQLCTYSSNSLLTHHLLIMNQEESQALQQVIYCEYPVLYKTSISLNHHRLESWNPGHIILLYSNDLYHPSTVHMRPDRHLSASYLSFTLHPPSPRYTISIQPPSHQPLTSLRSCPRPGTQTGPVAGLIKYDS